LFNPEGIKPEKYQLTYPELSRISEFAGLSGRKLVFIWWYANQTSPFLSDPALKEPNKHKRVEKALEKSGVNLSKVERDKWLKLEFDENILAAIDRMGKFDVSRRYRANSIVKRIFDNFELMTEEGLKGFSKIKTVEVDGEITTETNTDYSKYIDASAKIVNTLPDLLERLEEGFGTDKNKSDDDDNGEFNSDWYKNKNNQ
jgi:hypothetical protein